MLMDDVEDYLYLGDAATFTGTKFEWQTRGSNYTIKVEYYSGLSGDGWDTMTSGIDNLVDGSTNFASNGLISWDTPGDWATTAINGQTKYWIRISTTTLPVSTARCYMAVPGDSVVGLLALSSTEIQEESWKWCSYLDDVYVTLRNTGSTTYEGNYYLASSSSITNKQNYFIYNHSLTLDHEDSTYVAA